MYSFCHRAHSHDSAVGTGWTQPFMTDMKSCNVSVCVLMPVNAQMILPLFRWIATQALLQVHKQIRAAP